MTPAEELRAAAANLRELAAKAAPGPWQACAPWTTGGEYPTEVRSVTTQGYPNTDVAGWAVDTELDGYQGGMAPSDAAWVALLGPDKAAPIAALLEHYANSVAWSDNWDDVRNCGVPIKRFARSILGGTQ